MDAESLEKMGTAKDCFVALTCRSIRVGSYKAAPKEKATFTTKGFQICMPDIHDGMKLFLPIKEYVS